MLDLRLKVPAARLKENTESWLVIRWSCPGSRLETSSVSSQRQPSGRPQLVLTLKLKVTRFSLSLRADTWLELNFMTPVRGSSVRLAGTLASSM